MKSAASICADAAALVSGDRQVTHGDKMTNFRNIASIWTAILEVRFSPMLLPLDPLDVANMMEAMKIARRYSGTHNIDDYVDGAGYAGCAGEIAENMKWVE